jgi:hypothetical protein
VIENTDLSDLVTWPKVTFRHYIWDGVWSGFMFLNQLDILQLQESLAGIEKYLFVYVWHRFTRHVSTKAPRCFTYSCILNYTNWAIIAGKSHFHCVFAQWHLFSRCHIKEPVFIYMYWRKALFTTYNKPNCLWQNIAYRFVEWGSANRDSTKWEDTLNIYVIDHHVLFFTSCHLAVMAW